MTTLPLHKFIKIDENKAGDTMSTRVPLERLKAKDEDVVYIGRKSVISYVLAAVTQFNTGNSNKVVLKARGRAISKAIDVSEIMMNKFIQELKIDDIQVGTEEVSHRDGTTSNMPSIEIYMSK